MQVMVPAIVCECLKQNSKSCNRIIMKVVYDILFGTKAAVILKYHISERCYSQMNRLNLQLNSLIAKEKNVAEYWMN